MTNQFSDISFSVLDLSPVNQGSTAAESFRNSLSLAQHAERLGGSIIGGAATVEKKLERMLSETGADELMINAMIFDHAARLRSYEIVADVWREKTSMHSA